MFKCRVFVSQNFVGALFHKINPKVPGLRMLTDMQAQHEDFESPVYRRPESIRCLVRVSSCVYRLIWAVHIVTKTHGLTKK